MDAKTVTISDHGMILACMAVLKGKGMSRQDAVPIYQRLLDHHGLTAETINQNLAMALAHLPSEELARTHLVEVCPELAELI